MLNPNKPHSHHLSRNTRHQLGKTANRLFLIPHGMEWSSLWWVVENHWNPLSRWRLRALRWRLRCATVVHLCRKARIDGPWQVLRLSQSSIKRISCGARWAKECSLQLFKGMKLPRKQENHLLSPSFILSPWSFLCKNKCPLSLW